jgi:hypothetical protein
MKKGTSYIIVGITLLLGVAGIITAYILTNRQGVTPVAPTRPAAGNNLQSCELMSFTVTVEGSPSPSASSTATPSSTSTPSPTASSTPTATQTPRPTNSPAPGIAPTPPPASTTQTTELPDTGINTPLYLIIIPAAVLLASAIFLI